jgi:hypothetical protein
MDDKPSAIEPVPMSDNGGLSEEERRKRGLPDLNDPNWLTEMRERERRVARSRQAAEYRAHRRQQRRSRGG